MLERQYQTPFVFSGSSYMYQDYNAMCESLEKLAKNITTGGLPQALTPFVIGVTGTGRCAQGSLEVLEQLPHDKVPASELRAYVEDKSRHSNKKIVIVQFTSLDVAKKPDGSPFEKKEYYANPEKFVGRFEEYLDLVHFLVNDIYWEAKYPRLITKEGLKAAVLSGKNKLMGVTDISADEAGSIEFTTRFTSIDEPYLLYDPISMKFKEKISEIGKNDILFTSVDHLPAEMPVEASNHFGSKLLPFVLDVVKSDISKPFDQQKEDLPAEIYNAVICAHGALTPNYTYIEELRALKDKMQESEDSSSIGMQGFTLQLQGHLFDKQIFNRILDMFESRGINFRVVKWSFG